MLLCQIYKFYNLGDNTFETDFSTKNALEYAREYLQTQSLKTSPVTLFCVKNVIQYVNLRLHVQFFPRDGNAISRNYCIVVARKKLHV